jgi:hypothetical protein
VLTTSCKPFRWSLLLGGLLAVGLLPTVRAHAQDGDQGDSGSSYRTGENTPRNDQPFTEESEEDLQAVDPKTEGPVRLTRFAYVQGDVTWRPDSSASWSKATNNLPLRQGAEIMIAEGGRADLQFDDGSSLRLGKGAQVTLKVLYSDDKGEFTEIVLSDGLATLHSRHSDAVYQVDTPMASVKLSGDTQVRLGADNGSEIAVQQGRATIEGSAGKTTLEAGNYLYLRDASSAYNPRRIPGADSWDQWNSERNRLIEGKSETYKHVPSNIGLVAEDLDTAGTWHNDSEYGWIWSPRVSAPDWRPYYYGHWVWVDPFGWTWVSDESWGWAPYHYGTWLQRPYGWAWCPGSRWQYWSPGVVSFSSYSGGIGWAPLCPWEVRYPSSFSLGYWGGNWGLSFSIGWAGCYYPGGSNYCYGRPFSNRYVNRWNDNYRRTGSYDRFRNSQEAYAVHSRFVPYNATHGATFASQTAFNGRGTYRAGTQSDASLFKSGRPVVAPAKGVLSGPTSIQPTGLARTSTRSFVTDARPSLRATQRNVYQSPLPTNVQRSLPASQQRGVDFTSRAARPGVTSENANSPTGRAGVSGNGNVVGRTGGAPTSVGPTTRTGTSTFGGSVGRAGTSGSGAPQDRSKSGFAPGVFDRGAGVTGGQASNPNRSAADAARQARASLGMDGSGRSGGSTYGGNRTSGGGSTYAPTGRANQGGGTTYSPGRSSGTAPGSYRNGSDSPSSGGGRSSGGGGNTGGGGGRSSGGGGNFGGGSSGGRSYGGGGRSSDDSSGSGGRSGGGGSFNRGRR